MNDGGANIGADGANVGDADVQRADLVTLTEAAEALGVSARTLRRALDAAEGGPDAALVHEAMRTVTRQTASGARPATVYPLDLLVALIADRPKVGNKGGAKVGASRADIGNVDAYIGNADVPADQGAPVYDALALAEERRRADVAEAVAAEVRGERDRLAAALDHARADLDKERRAHERSQTLHLGTQGELSELRRRAQELESQNARLIEALPVSTIASDAPESGDNAPQGETPAPGFWARVFGKGKGTA